MKSDLITRLMSLAAGLAIAVPGVAHAQSLPYGDVAAPSAGGGEDIGGDDAEAGEDDSADGNVMPGVHTRKVSVTPYIEFQQVVTTELSPGNETLTWSSVAVGADASIRNRNAEAGLAVRYERRFGWGSNAEDSDAVTGIARASVGVVPGTLYLEGGAMAARVGVQNNGSTVSGSAFSPNATQIWSAYIGPSIRARGGDVEIEGHYRFGYNKVSAPLTVPLAPGQAALDVYDEGTVHNAMIHFGTRAGVVLPVGLGVGAGWNREDVSNLDQRIDDRHVRADATLPLGPDLALVGGVGYEDVKVSHRDALIDTLTGLPVIGSDGRYVTDTTQPRQIAFETDGLIWDAGVMWRPSKRTALEAHVGRRYGSTTYFGSFAYAPNTRTAFNVSVYDNITGFGGLMNNTLADLPTQFEGVRNPLTGGLGTCVSAQGSVSQGGANCLNGALASIGSSTFRGRGVMASLALGGGALGYGVAGGYERRKFIAAPGTILAAANGVTDENYWVAAYLNGRIDQNSSFGTNVWASWYQSGDVLAGNTASYGATAAYYRSLTPNLTANAAVGINGVESELLQDFWSASALVGLRLSF
ncbi:preprotein translocase subunit YajC [Novosphingobium sp.]|uniref:preprotein translocase subunit YajC n=1 Tax=Novosphingobium sp. TaxID=1874826 RepID=UPI00286ADF1F|nr:preprotein translocase subunit YajC [Novosphingobium sp.]